MPRYWARSEGAAMSILEIQLKGYEVEPRSVTLGTYDSYGLETLQLVPDALWADLSIVATFNAPGGSHKRVKADTDLCVQVPPEAVENEGGVGTVVFVGLQDGQRRISRDLEYTVADHGNADGTEAAPPQPLTLCSRFFPLPTLPRKPPTACGRMRTTANLPDPPDPPDRRAKRARWKH